MRKHFLAVLKKSVIGTVIFLAISLLSIFIYMRQAKFGKAPWGARLEKIKKSANYRDGAFQNISFTPQLTEGYSIAKVTYEFLFKKNKRRAPLDTLPSVKTDLKSLPADSNVLVWFGHSSYFIQLDGKKILVDPVFSGNASPISGTNKSFKGSDIYSVDDLPQIDYLFISHDHYDHLDYETIILLKGRVNKIFCGLGVGSHLEYWGYDTAIIEEHDWYESVYPDPGFEIHFTPARHFSGRSFKRNNTLWVSFVLKTPSQKIFLGGDSGYDTHFAAIGKKYGPFELAILENGQYDIRWKYIHTLPEELIQTVKDLNAKRMFPVHSSKFALAHHAWDEPLIMAYKNATDAEIPIITPLIGETTNLNDPPKPKEWWLKVR